MPILTPGFVPCARARPVSPTPQKKMAADKIPDFIVLSKPFLFPEMCAHDRELPRAFPPVSPRKKVWEPGVELALRLLRSRGRSGLLPAPAIGEVAHDHVEDRREHEAEHRDADHAEEHGDAHGFSDLRSPPP